jgi:hypothetical protein
MGGSWENKKATVESCKSISTIFLLKHGYFKGAQSGAIRWSTPGEHTGSVGFKIVMHEGLGTIRFQYFSTDQYARKMDCLVHLTPTPCNYGGYRWWFRCPKCWRRVEKLYLRGKYFGCRKCQNLTYLSCQENDKRVNRLLRHPESLAGLNVGTFLFGKDFVTVKAILKIENAPEDRRRKRT